MRNDYDIRIVSPQLTHIYLDGEIIGYCEKAYYHRGAKPDLWFGFYASLYATAHKLSIGSVASGATRESCIEDFLLVYERECEHTG